MKYKTFLIVVHGKYQIAPVLCEIRDAKDWDKELDSLHRHTLDQDGWKWYVIPKLEVK